jgi:hypothetical protein
MDLPNVYWAFTTPLATIIGLFSNVSETEAEIHQDQIDWFRNELKTADTDKALFESFAATGIYPHLMLSGHVHNYQRFTATETVAGDPADISCIVIGNGGYTRLGTLHKIDGDYPEAPPELFHTLKLESYDQENFGFLRLEVTEQEITSVVPRPIRKPRQPLP